jgi:hypothetical protein
MSAAGSANNELLLAGNQLGLNAGQSGSIRDPLNAAPGVTAVQTPEDEANLRAQLLKEYSATSGMNPGSINPDFQNTLKTIQTQLAGQPNLATLDPAAQASLSAITAGNQEKFDLQQTQLKQDLLNNLFGAGTERSTIALDAGGRLAYGTGANQAQLLADAAQRELGLRSDVSNRTLQNLQLQAGVTGQGGNLALGEQQLLQQGQNARGSLLNALFGNQLTRDQGNVQAGLQNRQLLQQDAQFREGNVLDLAAKRAGIQAGRKSGFGDWAGQIIPAGLSLAGKVFGF